MTTRSSQRRLESKADPLRVCRSAQQKQQHPQARPEGAANRSMNDSDAVVMCHHMTPCVKGRTIPEGLAEHGHADENA